MKDLKDYIYKNKKTHIIFDFDETLVKLIIPWENALLNIEDKLNKIDPKILSDYNENKISLSVLQNEYTKNYGKDALDLFIKNNQSFEIDELIKYEVNNKLIKFIINNQNLNFYIWSSNTDAIINKILEEIKIDKLFKYIITRNNVELLKPYSNGFSQIYNSNISKDKYLFIGDSVYDKEASVNSEIDFLYEDYFKIL